MCRLILSTGAGAIRRHVGQMKHAMGMCFCFLCCDAPGSGTEWKGDSKLVASNSNHLLSIWSIIPFLGSKISND